MFKQYDAIHSLILDSLSLYSGTDYLTHLLREILLDGLSEKEQEYLDAKYVAIFTHHNTDIKIATLLTNWYVNKEGYEVFNEYPHQFKNLVDYLITRNDIFISHLDIPRRANIWRLETLLNG
jgi:hypothetical protein